MLGPALDCASTRSNPANAGISRCAGARATSAAGAFAGRAATII
jgi:hypothetical protein